MDRQAVANIAAQSLKTLQDDRVMIPATAVETFADLKSILHGLMSGQHVLVSPPPPKAPDGEPND